MLWTANSGTGQAGQIAVWDLGRIEGVQLGETLR